MKHMKYLTVFLSFVHILSIGNYVYANNTLAPTEKRFVIEWDVVSPNEADIPKISKMQLLAEVEKSIKSQQAFSSWEAKYNVTYRQSPQKRKDRAIPEFITSSQIHAISNGPKWLYQLRIENKGETAIVHHEKVASDGRVVRMILPDEKHGQVKDPNQHRVSGIIPTLVDFLPYLPAESCLASRDFQEVLDILDAPDTKLLPWYTRVDGHTCYVLEQTTKREKPVFRASQQAANWKKETPKEANSLPKIQVYTTKTRLAIDPELDFAIVRWARGNRTELPSLRITAFPLKEIIYGDFHHVADGIYIPWQMTYTGYTFDKDGTRKVNQQTRMVVEEFAVNRQYEPGLFEVDFPDGYYVIDINKGISYTAGDSEEKISALVTAAKARKTFYDKLRTEEAPSLEYSRWINSKPIRLVEHKGRAIILHFWSLGCRPYMAEMPWLQKKHGQTLEPTLEPLFISIHPFVDGEDLKQLEKVIEKKGITFPVMVDSLGTEKLPWGKTLNKYRVLSIPTEVRIDENGHFEKIDKEFIGTDSQWLKKSEGPRN